MAINPATIALAQAALSGAISGVKFIVKQIQAWRAAGLITVEQQATLMKQVDSIRDGTAFEGPEWQISPPKPPE